MSEHDIDKGTRNMPVISRNLEQTHFGIICLTPENLNAPWLLFEAGALSKSQDDARVWTLLYELENTDVEGPLSQFQHTKAKENDVRKLLQAINRASGGASVTDQQLQVSFDRGWRELEEKLRDIPLTTEAYAPKRSDRELIEESLTILRKIATGATPAREDPNTVWVKAKRIHDVSEDEIIAMSTPDLERYLSQTVKRRITTLSMPEEDFLERKMFFARKELKRRSSTSDSPHDVTGSTPTESEV